MPSQEYIDYIAKIDEVFQASKSKPLPMTEVKASDLEIGMVIDVWFGTGHIAEILPYTGPISFCIGVLSFHGTRGKMSITSGQTLKVTTESIKPK